MVVAPFHWLVGSRPGQARTMSWKVASLRVLCGIELRLAFIMRNLPTNMSVGFFFGADQVG